MRSPSALASLGVSFCGFDLPHPFLLAATPASRNGEMISRAFEMGWAGAVWKTIGQVPGVPNPKVSPAYHSLRWNHHIWCFENIDLGNPTPLDETLREISRVKAWFPDRLLVVSLRGDEAPRQWQELAIVAQQAGADMLELMVSCPHDASDNLTTDQTMTHTVSTVTRWIQAVASLPVMVKISPNTSDARLLARAAKGAGAQAISAANTIRCLAGVDLDTLVPLPSVGEHSCFGGCSGPALKPIVLQIVAELAMDPFLGLPLSAIGGVSDWRDAVEYLLVGATTVQVGTAVMLNGYRILEDLLSGLSNFLEQKGFSSCRDLIGHSIQYLTGQPQLSREHVVKARIVEEKCVRCLRCYVACRDGAHQAIEVGEDRLPWVDESRCVGCALCQQTCPVPGAVRMVQPAL